MMFEKQDFLHSLIVYINLYLNDTPYYFACNISNPMDTIQGFMLSKMMCYIAILFRFFRARDIVTISCSVMIQLKTFPVGCVAHKQCTGIQIILVRAMMSYMATTKPKSNCRLNLFFNLKLMR